jgi:hypothetical protein
MREQGDTDGGPNAAIRAYAPLQKIWVEMRCSSDSRTHGPTLELRLLDGNAHAGALEAKRSFASSSDNGDALRAATRLGSSLSRAMRDVVRAEAFAAAHDDTDDDNNVDAAHAVEHLDIPALKVFSPAHHHRACHHRTSIACIAEPLAALKLGASCGGVVESMEQRVTVDDGPERTLRVARSTPSIRHRAYRERHAAHVAWVRASATRVFNAASRARLARRRQRAEDRYARVDAARRHSIPASSSLDVGHDT